MIAVIFVRVFIQRGNPQVKFAVAHRDGLVRFVQSRQGAVGRLLRLELLCLLGGGSGIGRPHIAGGKRRGSHRAVREQQKQNRDGKGQTVRRTHFLHGAGTAQQAKDAPYCHHANGKIQVRQRLGRDVLQVAAGDCQVENHGGK